MIRCCCCCSSCAGEVLWLDAATYLEAHDGSPRFVVDDSVQASQVRHPSQQARSTGSTSC